MTRLRPKSFAKQQQDVKLASVPCENVSVCVASTGRANQLTVPRAPQLLPQLQSDHRFEANSFSNCQDTEPH